ncbi:MAG: VirB3 family type IV secretion system protein [Legionellaceae bacterium]|nr:VirB3 family type IV secretion system protein [Legionellaceae bacterium]
MEAAELMIHPIFGALTRPAMTAGVTFEYHMLNLMASMCVFIGVSPLYGLMFIPLHVFGWLVCQYDIHFFSICAKRFLRLPQVPNATIWRVRAYEPF